MKKFNRVLLVFGGLLFFVVLLVFSYLRHYGWWNGKDDLKFGVVADNGISIISVSWDRRMINILSVNPDVEVWVPGGLSWYKADKIKRLLIQENKQNDLSDVFFYNFGLRPDRVLWLDKKEDWENINNLWWKVGPITWANLKSKEKIMLTKYDIFDESLKNNAGLEETLFRDFSDNRIAGEQVRITVVNATELSGLATWLASRLEWSGMSVVGLETANQLLEKCKILYSDEEVRKTESYKLINSLGRCDENFDENLVKGEVQMLIGLDLAEMINYSSYN